MHATSGSRATLAQAILARLTQPDESVDGILCWDLFDFLDRPTGQALAHRLARLVRKGGVLHGFFGTTPMELRHYSRYVIEAADTSACSHLLRRRRVARTVRLTARHHQDVRRSGGRRIRAAEEQDARDPVPPALSGAPHFLAAPDRRAK